MKGSPDHDFTPLAEHKPKTLEFITPAYDAKSRSTQALPSALVLMSTMIGGGMLTLPYAFSVTGLLGGLILQLLSGAAAAFSLYILIASARRTGGATYSAVAADAFGPRAAVVVALVTLVQVVMAMIAYSILLRDLIDTALDLLDLDGPKSDLDDAGQIYYDDDLDDGAADSGSKFLGFLGRSDGVLLGLLLAVAFPIGLNRSLGGLKFVTPFSIGSMLVLLVAVTFRGGAHARAHWGNLEYRLWPADGMAILRAVPVFTLSYMCHFNALSVHAELRDPTRGRLKWVIGFAVLGASTVYTLFGLAGYLYAGAKTQGDVLSNFPADDGLINLGRVGLGVALLCNIPLCILPARDLLFLLAAMASTGPGAGAGEGTVNALTAIDAALVELDDGVDDGASEDKPAADAPTKAVSSSSSSSSSTGSSSEATPLRSKGPGHGATTQADAEAGATAGFAGAEANSLEGSVSGHVLLTLGILLLVFVGATACQGVEVVWGLCGSSVGTALALVLPSAIYFKLRRHKGGWRMGTTLLFFLVSLFLLVVCTAISVAENI